LGPIFSQLVVLVRGGGDLGSGVVYRLYRAGFPVIVVELGKPLFVRRAVCYGAAVFEGQITVDGVTARLAADSDAVRQVLAQGDIPVIIDPAGDSLASLSPFVLVDARMAKQPLDTHRDMAPLVIGLGPGFEVGIHCHAVVETNRGHYLGRVYWQGQAEPDTGSPGRVEGVTDERVMRAPKAGYVLSDRRIGDMVQQGEVVATIEGQPIHAQLTGVVRGLIHPRVLVSPGTKIGDIDPRAQRAHCFTISDKSLAVGGGVLEAVFSSVVVRRELLGRDRET
jgi:xanthine dehydrogenase accessory factor